MARSIPILQVDAFTCRPFEGNPAGVVLDADGLSVPEMQRIAREMNVAETAFVSRTPAAGADLRLRWFTPTGHEIAFCGHATVAAVHALAEAGRLRVDRLVFDTLGGPLPVRALRGESRVVIWLEPGLPEYRRYAGPIGSLLAAVGVEEPGDWAAPALTAERDVLLPVPTVVSLERLAPDPSAIARIATAEKLRGFCCVALGGVDTASRTHSRFFAPHLGIPEDPVTGSVHAVIPVWLWDAGALPAEGDTVCFTAEQGDFLGRRGRLRIELSLDRGRPARVRVGGEAVTVLTGTLRLD